MSSSARAPLPGHTDRDNRGDHPTALWITDRGLASGYHHTDKLTPDGLLCGYDHDDFSSPVALTYAVELGVERAAGFFARLRAPEFRDLPDRIDDARVCDGFTLQIRWRLAGAARQVWICNSTHPVVTPFVVALWSYVPAAITRIWPDFDGRGVT